MPDISYNASEQRYNVSDSRICSFESDLFNDSIDPVHKIGLIDSRLGPSPAVQLNNSLTY